MEKDDTVHKQEKIAPQWLLDVVRNDGGQKLMFIAQWTADIGGCINISDDDLINLTEEEKGILKTSMSQSSLKQALGVMFLDPILVEKKKAILREIPTGEVGLTGDPALMDFTEIEGKELAIWSYRFPDTRTLCFTLVQKGQEDAPRNEMEADVANQVDQEEVQDHHNVAPTWLRGEMDKDHGHELTFVADKIIADKSDSGFIWFSSVNELVNLTDFEKATLKKRDGPLQNPIDVWFLNPISLEKKEAKLQQIWNRGIGLISFPKLMDLTPIDGKEAAVWSYRMPDTKLCFTLVPKYDVPNIVRRTPQRHPFSYLTSLVRDLDDLPTDRAS